MVTEALYLNPPSSFPQPLLDPLARAPVAFAAGDPRAELELLRNETVGPLTVKGPCIPAEITPRPSGRG